MGWSVEEEEVLNETMWLRLRRKLGEYRVICFAFETTFAKGVKREVTE